MSDPDNMSEEKLAALVGCAEMAVIAASHQHVKHAFKRMYVYPVRCLTTCISVFLWGHVYKHWKKQAYS